MKSCCRVGVKTMNTMILVVVMFFIDGFKAVARNKEQLNKIMENASSFKNIHV